MPRKVEFRAPRDADEHKALADVSYQSFAGFGQPYERTPAWMKLLGDDAMRIALADGQIVGGMGLLRFGQFFGGRRVDSVGVSMVSMWPEHRGGGVGVEMIRGLIRELAAGGVAISSLYPSTIGFYRKAGYEPAGLRMIYKVELRTLGRLPRERKVRPMTAADRPFVSDVHRARAMIANGPVDRTPRDWERVLDFTHTDTVFRYVVEGKSKSRPMEGYIVYTQASRPRAPYEIVLRDWAAATPEAGRALLRFLVAHTSMAGTVMIDGNPMDPILSFGAEQYAEAMHRIPWMLRVVTVSAALEQRGYPAGLNTELHLSIDDDLIRSNRGKFVLSIADRRGTVRRGGRGSISMDVRGLAPLFTSLRSAEELKMLGLADGRADELALASTAFAGPAPWLSDRF